MLRILARPKAIRSELAGLPVQEVRRVRLESTVALEARRPLVRQSDLLPAAEAVADRVLSQLLQEVAVEEAEQERVRLVSPEVREQLLVA
jgi:hypothetical protein